MDSSKKRKPRLRVPSLRMLQFRKAPCRALLTIVALWVAVFFGNRLAGQELPAIPQAVYLAEADGEVTSGIARSKTFLKNQNWSEAIQELRRAVELQDDAGEVFILKYEQQIDIQSTAESRAFRGYVSLQQHVNHLLCSLSEEQRPALEAYRSQVDPLALRWLNEAIAKPDKSRFGAITHNYLASSSGDEAVDALAEIELQTGNYHRAIHYWSKLLAETASAYPNPSQEQSLTKAKIVLARILANDVDSAIDRDLANFKAKYGEEVGTLGGSSVRLASKLKEIYEQRKQWQKRESTDDWPTFAGAFNRCPRKEPFDIGVRPVWSCELGKPQYADVTASRKYGIPEIRSGENARRACSYFPIVVKDQVVFANDTAIKSVSLGEGKLLWKRSNASLQSNQFRPSTAWNTRLGIPRFTLSSNRNTVIARLGSPNTLTTNPIKSQSSLASLDIDLEGKLGLTIESPEGLIFDGAPVIAESRIWISMRKAGFTPQVFVACFDANNGRELWRRSICASPTLGSSRTDEVTCNLLTYYQGLVFANTNQGAVAAIDAVSGDTQWIVTYPRRGAARHNMMDRSWHLLRDLTPCLPHQGLVIVAPTDCDAVFAVDAFSGELKWHLPTSDWFDATQLLGVVNEKLIVTGRRVWWIDIENGRPSEDVAMNPFPSSRHADFSGFGRGVIAGNTLYWPVRGDQDELFVINAKDGGFLRQPIPLSNFGAEAGNLSLAGNFLLIASPSKLFAFRAHSDSEGKSSAKR